MSSYSTSEGDEYSAVYLNNDSLRVRLRRMTAPETEESESYSVSGDETEVFGELGEDSDDTEVFGELDEDNEVEGALEKASTPIVISSDEEDDEDDYQPKRRGEVNITSEDNQRAGEGYIEYTRNVGIRLRIFTDTTATTPGEGPPPKRYICEAISSTTQDDGEMSLMASEGLFREVDEAATNHNSHTEDEDLMGEIMRWLDANEAEITNPPTNWRNLTGQAQLPTELTESLRRHLQEERRPGTKQSQRSYTYTYNIFNCT
ncbi:PREDICTED: uncharacterized protein LOC108367442 [Rhagoletis zephyria]|uniref:uncharacterized protein LOC108367442 n=1 Tax=Rhagoletis zephyria TaxID=28612 RepID=UPI0008116049|nr:PREDICTED: uncharacterized protein LOC108367442 [Rhagoletis zephyria]XP_017477542.1 PREDICTED: uncharacterized protein LOC108367442 [Rhagoletis zephyria]